MIQESFHRKDMQPILAEFEEYLRLEKSGGLAPGSIDRYLLNLRHLQTESGKHLFELTTYKAIADAIRGLRTRHRWSRSTTKNCADTASVFYNWALRFQHIPSSPLALGHEFKRGELAQMDFFDWEDPGFKKLIYNPNNSVQENAIFHTLRSVGLRASPLCRLKFRNPSDVFLKERFVRVRKDKGGSWHELTFDEETQHWLSYHLQTIVHHTAIDYLFQRKNFTQPYTPNTLNKLISRKADKIGLHACPQKFRRSLGGEMIQNGADLTMVKEQLCHKRISTTADHYVQFTSLRKKANYDRYVPKMNRTPSPKNMFSEPLSSYGLTSTFLGGLLFLLT